MPTPATQADCVGKAHPKNLVAQSSVGGFIVTESALAPQHKVSPLKMVASQILPIILDFQPFELGLPAATKLPQPFPVLQTE
jgi:hypothetical protein